MLDLSEIVFVLGVLIVIEFVLEYRLDQTWGPRVTKGMLWRLAAVRLLILVTTCTFAGVLWGDGREFVAVLVAAAALVVLALTASVVHRALVGATFLTAPDDEPPSGDVPAYLHVPDAPGPAPVEAARKLSAAASAVAMLDGFGFHRASVSYTGLAEDPVHVYVADFSLSPGVLDALAALHPSFAAPTYGGQAGEFGFHQWSFPDFNLTTDAPVGAPVQAPRDNG